MLNPFLLRNQLDIILSKKLPTTATVAREIAKIYKSFALLATPTPVILPPKEEKFALTLQKGLSYTSVTAFTQALDSALLEFWTGVVLTGGGIVVGYAGSVLLADLPKKLKVGITRNQASVVMANAVDKATRLVSYTVGPAGPFFLT